MSRDADFAIKTQDLFGPCVYVFWRGRQPLYVGCAKNGFERIAYRGHAGDKTHNRQKAIIKSSYVTVKFFNSHKQALAYELELIRKLKPTANRHKGPKRKSRCLYGHKYSINKITGRQYCAICMRKYSRESARRRRSL